MKSPEEAWAALEPHLEALAPETVRRDEAAFRVLAEPVAATVDVPAAAVSAMDGYALAGAALGSPIRLTGTIAAGDAPGHRLERGSAVRIMTGAPLPVGADRVVPVEVAEEVGGCVRVLEETEAGAHVRERGEIVAAGEPLFAPGAVLVPGALAVLATHGIGSVAIIRRPVVATIVTGNEVVPPEQEPGPGQLRDSHGTFFRAAAAPFAASVRHLGIVRDDPEELRRCVREGLEADVLILSGGVSKGVFDFVATVLAELGCEILVDSVSIQPGKPMVAARHPDAGSRSGWIFGLPGNPASAMVTFWLFVRPVLRRLQGLHDHFWHGALAARLDDRLPEAGTRDRFLPGVVRFENGEIHVRPVLAQGSHDLAAYGTGTVLVRAPAGTPARNRGESCEVLPLIDWPSERQAGA